MYPLALGAGVSEEGFVLKYAMPDMNVTTGQEKPEEDPVSVLTLRAEIFRKSRKSTIVPRKNFWIWDTFR